MQEHHLLNDTPDYNGPERRLQQRRHELDLQHAGWRVTNLALLSDERRASRDRRRSDCLSNSGYTLH